MSSPNDDLNLALFCDFENVALGVRDANYAKFDIQLVLERLLLKGSIVVKKAYCDWDRYKEFKPVMHEAAFELIEIPHTRQSGKNSADIRMVVDALDLCYTKEHIDTFVIISGDSDFSPLVSKLRENAKLVIGVGVKDSTSNLLMSNCDEFIYYDDLIREEQSSKRRKRKPAAKKAPAKAANGKKSGGKKDDKVEDKSEDKSEDREEDNTLDEAISLIMETAEALDADQGHGQKLWGSMVKQTLKRRRPGFNERFYGARSFGELLEEAENRGLLSLELDERSGGYVIKSLNREK
jgi:uncharacterized protein (TIGR00288 family)